MQPKQSCIYKIVNRENNNCYVGSTIDFHRRKRGHLNMLLKNKHHSRHLQFAYNLYGLAAFEFFIIENCSPEQLIIREQYWHDQLNPVYSVMKDIKSHLGLKRSDETRRKISLANTGKTLSCETKEKLRLANIGKKRTQESKDKTSRILKNSIVFQKAVKSKERSDKIVAKRKQDNSYAVSETTRKQISQTLKAQNLQSAISIGVEKYTLNNEFICFYASFQKAEVDNNFWRGSLSHRLNVLKNEIYKGFKWKAVSVRQ